MSAPVPVPPKKSRRARKHERLKQEAAALARKEKDLIAEEWLKELKPYAAHLPLCINFTTSLPVRPAAVSQAALKRVIKKHVTSIAYLYASSQPNAVRYNPDGSISSPVSEQHKAYAGEKLLQLIASEDP